MIFRVWKGAVRSPPDFVIGHVVAKLDELVAEGGELGVELLLLPVCLLMLFGRCQNVTGCLFPGLHVALGDRCQGPERLRFPKKTLEPFLDLCVSSLRRGHANLLCIVPILSDFVRRHIIFHSSCIYTPGNGPKCNYGQNIRERNLALYSTDAFPSQSSFEHPHLCFRTP
jgi:hypothetical protein